MVTADGQSREVILTEVSCHPIYRWPKKTSGRKSISSFRTRTCPRKPCFSEVSPCHQSRSWRWNPNVFPIPTRGLYRSGIVTPVPQDVMWSPQLDCALRSQSCGQCKILAKFSGMDALRGNCGILRTPFAAASPTSFRIVAQEWVEVKYLDLGSWFRLRHNGSNLHVQIFKTFILSMPWLFWHLRPAVPSQRMRALLRAEVSFFPSRVLTSVARKMGPL